MDMDCAAWMENAEKPENINIYFKTNTPSHTHAAGGRGRDGRAQLRNQWAQFETARISCFMFGNHPSMFPLAASLLHAHTNLLPLFLCVCAWECVWHARRTVCVDAVKAESCLWRHRHHLHTTYHCRVDYATGLSLPLLLPLFPPCCSAPPRLHWGLRIGVGCLFDLQIVNWHSMIFDFQNWMMAASASVWRGWLK